MSRANAGWQGRVALITGASSGIGADVARRLAREGLIVALAARRADRLQALAGEICAAGGSAFVFPCDLCDAQARIDLHAAVTRELGGADVLFNNAGSGWYGYFSDMPWRVAAGLLAVNVEAAAHLSSLFLPGMLTRGRGHILNMGSLTGSLPVQGAALYGGSKAFLEGFTNSLYRELVGKPVHASLIRATAVRTEFFETSSAQEGASGLPGERFAVPVEAVTGAVWSLLNRPRRIAFVPWTMRFVPAVELFFGWAMDLLGPALLRRPQWVKRRGQQPQ